MAVSGRNPEFEWAPLSLYRHHSICMKDSQVSSLGYGYWWVEAKSEKDGLLSLGFEPDTYENMGKELHSNIQGHQTDTWMKTGKFYVI